METNIQRMCMQLMDSKVDSLQVAGVSQNGAAPPGKSVDLGSSRNGAGGEVSQQKSGGAKEQPLRDSLLEQVIFNRLPVPLNETARRKQLQALCSFLLDLNINGIDSVECCRQGAKAQSPL